MPIEVKISAEEKETLLSMARYWNEVRGRDDQSPLEFEVQQAVGTIGPSRVLALVQNAAEQA